MARFTSAPVETVIPKRKQRQPSQRAQIQEQYQDAVRNAIVENHEALVVELEGDDKPLTIRNRIKRAADVLGVTDVTIRRRKDRIIAYRGDEES
jgi:formaldehyde-activating enzyme involved in methanogenesis